MSKPINFRVSQQKRDQIHASAKKAGVSVSEYCRMALLEDRIIIRVEGLTEIFDAIHKLTDSDVSSDSVNQITAVVTAGIEQILDKLDNLNIQGGGSSGNMGYKEPSE